VEPLGGYGAVGSSRLFGVHEITAEQLAKFVNFAVDRLMADLAMPKFN
jgi:hypothetical protein